MMSRRWLIPMLAAGIVALDGLPAFGTLHSEGDGPPPTLANDRDGDVPGNDVSIDHLEALVAIEPDNAGAWRDLGWAYWRQGRLDKTRRVWSHWLFLDPDNGQAHALIGRLELAENRLNAAIDAFRRALERDPDLAQIRFTLARTLRWTGHLTEASDLLRSLAETDPENREIRMELARALSSNWDFEEALPLWSRLRSDMPDDPDIRLGEAEAAMQTGAPRWGVMTARQVARHDPGNRAALRLLTDAAEFDGHLEAAESWLTQWIDHAETAEEKIDLQRRLLALYRRRFEHAPSPRTHAPWKALAQRIAADSPRDNDAQMTLAFVFMQDRRFDEADVILHRVLRDLNPRSIHAHIGLLEIALARQRIGDAWHHFEPIRRFHPHDSYLAWYEARIHAQAGDAAAADAALDRLSAAGERGATAVLLYHALTPGDYGPALSVNRFREHLMALMQAGYTVVTPEEIHADWARHGETAGRHSDGRVRRVVAVTFDDALESAMRHGTQVALDYGLRFAQFIPVGLVERGEPYITGWGRLAEYAATGVWEYGSHLDAAHFPAIADATGTRAMPSAIRQWLAEARRFETQAEYIVRLREEYAAAQRAIEARLGHPARAVAYPYGDIGQAGLSNEPDAVQLNLQHAARHHDLGFIQGRFAHAVHGANPLLYERIEFGPHDSGTTVARYLLDHHPIILAERTRLALAQWSGRPAQARLAIRRLRDAGYDPQPMAVILAELTTALSPVYAVPVDVGDPASLDPRWIPRLSFEADFFSDRLKARHAESAVRLTVTRDARIQGALRYGIGRRLQDRQSDDAQDVGLNEQSVHASASVLDDARRLWSVALGMRQASQDSDRTTHVEARAEVHGRVLPELSLRLSAAREIPEQALAVARGFYRVRVAGDASLNLPAAWTIRGGGAWEGWSDDNRILDASAGAEVAPLSWRGLYLGGRTAYRQSDFAAPDYWSPRRMEAVYGLIGHRGQWLGGTYHVAFQAGWGKETGLEDSSGTTSSWSAVHGTRCEWNRALRDAWSAGAGIDWNRSPGYDMIRGSLHVGRRF